MPDAAVFSEFDWKGFDEFEKLLSKRSRRHFRQDVLPFVDTYDVSSANELSENDLSTAYKLYTEVKANNFSINNFEYGFGLFAAMNKSPLWQFLILRNKGEEEIQGIVFCYVNKSNNSFNPILIEMREDNSDRLTVYRQLLFQTILYAKEKGYSKIYMGVSAVFEKRKLGAKIAYRQAYVRAKDNYSIDLLQTYE